MVPALNPRDQDTSQGGPEGSKKAAEAAYPSEPEGGPDAKADGADQNSHTITVVVTVSEDLPGAL